MEEHDKKKPGFQEELHTISNTPTTREVPNQEDEQIHQVGALSDDQRADTPEGTTEGGAPDQGPKTGTFGEKDDLKAS